MSIISRVAESVKHYLFTVILCVLFVVLRTVCKCLNIGKGLK